MLNNLLVKSKKKWTKTPTKPGIVLTYAIHRSNYLRPVHTQALATTALRFLRSNKLLIPNEDHLFANFHII